MTSDNLRGFAQAGISCQSLVSVPSRMAIIARREAKKAEAGQTGLTIIPAALNSSFAKDAPHKVIMRR